MNKLEQKIQPLLEGLKGSAGIVLSGPDGDFRRNEDMVFPAASLIKLPILWEFFRRVQLEELNPDAEFVLRNEDKTDGFGILKELHSGIRPTFRDLATLMIILSDNTATNILIDYLGMPAINATCLELGMSRTLLRRKMMDADAKKKGLDNSTSPDDVARFFEHLTGNRDMPASFREEMIDILKRQQCNNKLAAGFSPPGIFAHKTGDLPGTEHDAGILFMENARRVIVILTKDLESNEEGILFHRAVAKIVQECAIALSN